MSNPLHKFYCSKKYLDLSKILKIKSEGVCERCAGIFDISYLRTHHKIYLTLENINDPYITLNEKNIEVICHDCHNAEHKRFGLPAEVRRVFLVHGAPSSGKTTYVAQVATRHDVIVDLEALHKAICNCNFNDKPDATKAESFALRDKLLERIKYRAGKWQDAYIIGGYPDRTEREQIVRDYGAELVHIATPKEECLINAASKNTEFLTNEMRVDWINSYFMRFLPDEPPPC